MQARKRRGRWEKSDADIPVGEEVESRKMAQNCMAGRIKRERGVDAADLDDGDDDIRS